MKNPNHITLENMNQALWYNRWTMNKFKQFLHSDILEVGCGIGNFTQSLALLGSVYAIDIDKACIRQTKKRVPTANVGFGDIEKNSYFFPKKTFQSIVCLNVLEHIADDEQALKNMHDLLAPSGVLILLVPIHSQLYGSIDAAIGHYRRYSSQQLLDVLKRKKFHILFHRKLNFLGAIGWWTAGKILQNTTIGNMQIKLFNIVAPLVLPLEDVIQTPFGTSVLIVAQKK